MEVGATGRLISNDNNQLVIRGQYGYGVGCPVKILPSSNYQIAFDVI